MSPKVSYGSRPIGVTIVIVLVFFRLHLPLYFFATHSASVYGFLNKHLESRLHGRSSRSTHVARYRTFKPRSRRRLAICVYTKADESKDDAENESDGNLDNFDFTDGSEGVYDESFDGLRNDRESPRPQDAKRSALTTEIIENNRRARKIAQDFVDYYKKNIIKTEEEIRQLDKRVSSLKNKIGKLEMKSTISTEDSEYKMLITNLSDAKEKLRQKNEGLKEARENLKLGREDLQELYNSIQKDLEYVKTKKLIANREKKKKEPRKNGQSFINSLMRAKFVDIPNSNGMQVLRNILNLERSRPLNIIVRNITKQFWDECIKQVDQGFRVVATGTPGVGKTTTTPLLIRTLLERNSTVVYLVRSDNKGKWYYEFIPNDDGSIITNVYPEKMHEDDIDSLTLESSYFVVDPGLTKTSCNPSTDFVANVIIVASPDPGHWGGSEFEKRRIDIAGTFKYFPLWNLEELLVANSILSSNMSSDDVANGYRNFGGVPRHVFERLLQKNLLNTQDTCINLLNLDQARKIARNQMDAIGKISENSPKSAIVGYVLSDTDNGSFSEAQVTIISDRVAEQVWSKFMVDLWFEIEKWEIAGPKIFEAYTRLLIYEKEDQYDCCLIGDASKKYMPLKLGGCKQIVFVQNPVQHVVDTQKSEPFVLYHSSISNFPLIDFLYRDYEGNVHAFQSTICKTGHTANVTAIKKLEQVVGDSSKLSIYYLVPFQNFQKFSIKPRNPVSKGVVCNIFSVKIPPPPGIASDSKK